MIDIPTLADQLGTTERHIRNLIARRKIPHVKVGALIRFEPEVVARWISENRVPALDEGWTGTPGQIPDTSPLGQAGGGCGRE